MIIMVARYKPQWKTVIKEDGIVFEYHSGYNTKREVEEMGKAVSSDYGRKYRIKYAREGKHTPHSIFDPRVKYVLYNTPDRRRKIRAYTTEIFEMMGGYYFVIRDRNYKMLHSSQIYKTKAKANSELSKYLREKGRR